MGNRELECDTLIEQNGDRSAMKNTLYIQSNLVGVYGDEVQDITLEDVKWCNIKGDGTYMMNNGDILNISMDDMGDYYLYDNDEDGMYIKQSDLSIC